MKKIGTISLSYCSCKTPFGSLAILWSVHRGQPKILRVLLSESRGSVKQLVKASFPDSISSSCQQVDVVINDIEAFLSGGEIEFSLEMVRMDLCSEFQQEVLRAEYKIPRGSVSTYQRIARHLGRPNGARAVGNALANNPFPIIVPCHRTIRSGGTLGGYRGGLKMKRTLLEMEGVQFNGFDQIVAGTFFY